MLNRGLDKVELLRIVEAVANEKSIDKEIVLESMESAIQKAALTKFGQNNNILVKIDRETGNISIQKVLDIVETVEDPSREITPKDANSINENKNETLKVGDKIYEDLPQIDFGRIAAQSAKQVINSKVKKIELSKLVAIKLAKKALEKKITKIFFDRGIYKYHGRVKIFAETLRENGMEF